VTVDTSRIAVSDCDVVNASRYFWFRPVGLAHYLLPGSAARWVSAGDEIEL